MSAPFFSDFGKETNDLFSKSYSKEPGGLELVSKRVTDDVTVESTIKVNSSATGVTPNSALKFTLQVPKVGEFEGDVNVDGRAKGTLKISKLVDNLTVKAALNSAALDKNLLNQSSFAASTFLTVQADYKIKAFTASAAVNTKGNNGAVADVSAVGAVADNVFLGAGAKLAVGVKDADVAFVQDYSAGVQFTDKKFSAAVVANSKLQKFALSYYNKAQLVGTKFEWNTNPQAGLLTIGSTVVPEKDTLFKVKASVGKEQRKFKDVFSITAFVERNFGTWKLGGTAEVDALTSVTKPTWYGISASLGD